MGSEKIAGCVLDLPTDTLSAWRDRALLRHEAEQVADHLPTCAACRARLADYEAVAQALRLIAVPEPVGGYGRNPRRWPQNRSVESERPNVPTVVRMEGPVRSRPVRRPRLLLAVEVAAALLLLVLLGGLLAWRGYAGPRKLVNPTATPTMALDPTAQAYVQVLRTDYPPFVAAEQQEFAQCHKVPASQPLAPCRPLEVAARMAAQTLLSHLAATSPPTSWRARDTALKQALQSAIAFNTRRIQAIDAQDRLLFQLTISDGNVAGAQLCAAIMRIDAGPPPLVPSLPVPAYGLDPQSPGCLQA